MRTHSPARLWLVVLTSAGLCVCAGCHVFVDGVASWQKLEADGRIEASAKPLTSDRWRPNTGWSPLHELLESPNPDPDLPLRRWTHPQLARALKAAEQQGLITTESRHVAERRATGLAAGAGDPAVNAWFASLARVNDLPGWNAAILWAHYDPIAARGASKVLVRLVQHPPSYTPLAEHEPQDRFIPTKGKSAENRGSENASRHVGLQIVSPNLQCAAAEAWCLVLGAAPGDPEEALAPAGVALESGKLSGKVANEIVRGIARRVQPRRIKHLVRALDATEERNPQSMAGRRAAAEACLVHAVQLRLRNELPAFTESGSAESAGDDPESLAAVFEEESPWPHRLWALRNDSDSHLRRRLSELAAVIRHPAAFKILKGRLSDIDVQVRDSAIESLGILGTTAARAELGELARRPEDRIRELAMRGLACEGPELLVPYVVDKSPQVRTEVARCVRRRPGPAAARLLRDLITDRSTEAQAAAVRTVHDWPENLATPLLLEALAGSAYKSRQAALKQLEERHGGGVAFPLLAGPQERALRVKQLMREWSIPETAVANAQELTRPGSPLLDQARLDDLRERLELAANAGDNEALANLAGWVGDLTPADLTVVERLLHESPAPQADVLLHQVLPKLSPAYAALAQMESADPAVRRPAASELAKIGQATSLSPEICRRLERLLKTEQDTLVWRFAMQGITRDGSDEAAQIALLAINSAWPDVRVLGCEYVGYHAQSEQAPWLMGLFYDANRAVQLAAIAAAGKCRNPVVLDGLRPNGDQAGLKGLRPLLTESQGQLQFTVVIAMSRVGDAAAMQELVRLSLDVNSTTRQEVVQIMGESGQTRFVESLIRLIWTEQNAHVRQTALASLLKLVPAAEQPSRLPQAKTPAEAVEIWVAWWEDWQSRRTPAAGSPASGN
jgi:HEAT repeat protein